mmetsp:Transcript_44655/g.148036  ORF Transcript_44655/g.148036 Transcript_44655/m.148036 type:complete len:277 (-) Transcript_44655:706-1536(-)
MREEGVGEAVEGERRQVLHHLDHGHDEVVVRLDLAEDGVEDHRRVAVRDLAQVAAVLLGVLLGEAAHHPLGLVGRGGARLCHQRRGPLLEARVDEAVEPVASRVGQLLEQPPQLVDMPRVRCGDSERGQQRHLGNLLHEPGRLRRTLGECGHAEPAQPHEKEGLGVQVQPQPLQHRQRGPQREQRRAPGRKRPAAAAAAPGQHLQQQHRQRGGDAERAHTRRLPHIALRLSRREGRARRGRPRRRQRIDLCVDLCQQLGRQPPLGWVHTSIAHQPR